LTNIGNYGSKSSKGRLGHQIYVACLLFFVEERLIVVRDKHGHSAIAWCYLDLQVT